MSDNLSPNFQTGQEPSAAQWNAIFAAKVDQNNGLLAIASTRPPAGGVPRSEQERWSEVLNPADFGPCGTANGIVDSAPALNAMFAYVRANVAINTGVTLKVNIPNDFYFCNSSVNAGGINGSNNTAFANSSTGVVIDFNGATLVGCFNGGIVFDYTGSNFLKVYNPKITNGGSIPGYSGVPALGMSGGVYSSASLGICNNHEFWNPEIVGNFSLACSYAMSTETTAFYSPRFYNSNPSASSYCSITDGQNHFGVSSTFYPMTLPADTAQSFGGMLFVQPDFRPSGGGSARWLSCTSSHRYIGGYLGVSGAVPSTVLWQSQSTGGGQANVDLYDDIGVETTNCTDVYLIAGPQVAPPLYGLTFITESPAVSNSIFKCDTNITSVFATDIRVKMIGYQNAALKMWDNASIWSWTGDISQPNGQSSLCATLPPSFEGRLAIGHQVADYLQTLSVAGAVKFGTYTGGIVAQAGYVTIIDAGGTSRRLLVG